MAYSYQEFVEWFGEHGGRQRWAKAHAPPVASVAIGVWGQIVGKGKSQSFHLLSYHAMIWFEGKPREVGQLLHVEAHPQHLHIMMAFLCTDSSLSGSDPNVVACCNCPRIVGRTWFAVADQRSAAQIAET